MTCLDFSIEGKTPEEIAAYFGVSVAIVNGAIIERQAKTYEDVNRYIQEVKKENELGWVIFK